MPMSLRDARQMTAKSRRRVWRLARAHGVTIAAHDRLLPDTAAHLIALAMQAARLPGADALAIEYMARRARRTTLEWGRNRAAIEAALSRMVTEASDA